MQAELQGLFKKTVIYQEPVLGTTPHMYKQLKGGFSLKNLKTNKQKTSKNPFASYHNVLAILNNVGNIESSLKNVLLVSDLNNCSSLYLSFSYK